jgi:hypothetical protein
LRLAGDGLEKTPHEERAVRLHRICRSGNGWRDVLAKAALPALADSGGNLAVSSVSGSRGDWGQAAYNDTARYITGAVLPVDGGTSASTGQGH